MAQTLETVTLPSIRRPDGVTAKQWRLAAIYPRAESAYAALIEAGYAPNTAAKRASNMLDRVGVKRATAAIQESQADRARGIMSVGKLALASAESDLQQLDPRDRLAAGAKFVELAANLGENIETTGNADRYHARIRRACRLMARLTELRLRTPQDVVFPPTPVAPTTENA